MANQDIFADVHCHTLLKYIQGDVVDLWEPIGKPNLLAHLTGLLRFTAADFKNLAQGEVQLVCVALTPPEQKTLFFQGKIPKAVLDKFSSFLSRIPPDKIKHYQSPNYDHYQLLNKERDLYIGGQNLTGKIKLSSTGKKTTCRYKIVKNYTDVENILNANAASKNERTIAVVFTIESMHALGTGHVEFGGPNPFNVGEDLLLKRVDAIKGIESPEVKAWDHAPVWVTMAHAFHNSICGHAQPLDGGFRKHLDYAEPFESHKTPPQYISCMNSGLTPLGKKVIERLLGIDAVSVARANPGKRIHVDTKHMSTKSRKEYYEILDAHMAAHPSDRIPVIMSHAAVNGKPSLDDNGFNPADSDDDYDDSKKYNPWSINLYDDEIIRVHKTKGLIGLIFYAPILSGKKKKKGSFLWGQKDWAELLSNQIEHIAKTVYATGAADKKEIWNHICIGSDFDGQINPTDKFATSDQFPTFKKFLIRFLNDDRFNPYRDPSEVEALADKICFKNVSDFLKNNY